MAPNLRGAVIALAGFALWAGHDALIKSLGTAYSPFQIVFFSVLLGFPLATVMLLRDREPGTLLPVHPGWMAARTVATVITATGAFYAFSALPLTTVYAILFASPLLITVLSIPVLGEVVRLRRWLAVIVGLSGVLIVLRPGTEALSLGHVAAMVSAIGAATVSVIVRRIGRQERPVVLLLYPMMGNFIVMGALLPLVYQPMPLGDLAKVAGIAVLGFAAMLCMVAAYRAGEAVIVAPMQYSQILWATAYGVLFFAEVPDLWTALGAGVVIASGVYIVLREARGDVSNTTPVIRTRSRIETGTHPRVGPLLRLWARRADEQT